MTLYNVTSLPMDPDSTTPLLPSISPAPVHTSFTLSTAFVYFTGALAASKPSLSRVYVNALLFSILLADLYVFKYNELFSWHPLFMIMGAIMLANGVMLYQRAVVRSEFTVYHIATQVMGLLFLFIGALVIYINKNNVNHAHLVSTHSLYGFASLVLFTGIALFGWVIRSNKPFIGVNRVKKLFVFHKAFGYIGLVGLGTTICYALEYEILGYVKELQAVIVCIGIILFARKFTFWSV